MITMQTIWKTSDGKIFENKQEAAHWDQVLRTFQFLTNLGWSDMTYEDVQAVINFLKEELT